MDYEIAFYVKNRAKYEREKTAPLSGAKLYPYKVDMATLTDYDKMKDKFVMEVVSAETNKDLPETVPHKDIEDMGEVLFWYLVPGFKY